MERFDEIHVVSDIHLGGRPGFQIFRQGERMVRWLERLRQAPAERLALVLNGDIVDFLAEPGAALFDREGAADKVRAIAARDAFAPVFQAFRDYLGTEGRVLVVVLGNHDIELALPPVEAALIEVLTEGDAARRGRLRLATDGRGWGGRAGDEQSSRSVYCFHGDVADAWNSVDHDGLRSVARAQLAASVEPEFQAAGGTRLVIEVMNRVKERFPVVDLLKPEMAGAVPLVLSFDPSQAAEAKRALRAVRKMTATSVAQRFGLLSGEVTAEAEQEALRALEEALPRSRSASAEELLAAVEDDLDADPMELVDSDRDATLGMGSAFLALVSRRSPATVVRELIGQGIRTDKSFLIDEPDGPYHWAAEQELLADVVVAGHTHLPREIPLPGGGGQYFNSGTWIPLIKLTEERVEGDFETLWRQLRDARSLDELDELGLLHEAPAAVRITSSGGELLLVQESGETVPYDRRARGG